VAYDPKDEASRRGALSRHHPSRGPSIAARIDAPNRAMSVAAFS